MTGTILLIVAGIFCFVIIAGIFIPSKFNFSRGTVIDADKKTVFNYIDDLSQWQQWSAWSKENDEKIKLNFDDKEKGHGATMSWKGKKMGKGSMEIVKADPYKEILIDANFNRGVFKMQYRFVVDDEKNKTGVTWYVTGRTRRSAPAKILGRMLNKWMGKDMETGLLILKKLCEQKS